MSGTILFRLMLKNTPYRLLPTTRLPLLPQNCWSGISRRSFSSGKKIQLHEVINLPVLELHKFAADNQDCTIIDVREKDELSLVSLSKVKFAHMPLSEAYKWMESLDLEMDQPIVCVCHHGVRSMRVANALSSMGYEKVYNLEGGIHAYACIVDKSIGTY